MYIYINNQDHELSRSRSRGSYQARWQERSRHRKPGTGSEKKTGTTLSAVQGLGLRVWGLGFRVLAFEMYKGLGCLSCCCCLSAVLFAAVILLVAVLPVVTIGLLRLRSLGVAIAM